MPCDSVARKSALIPMLFHALPRMQWALVGAKRLECGSSLPLCFYAQTTCLEPDRHEAANNVSVPISASEVASAHFGSRRLEQGAICGPRRDPGAKPK